MAVSFIRESSLPSNGNFKNISGEKFSRLTVVGFAGRTPDRKAVWDCVCDCGTDIPVTGKALRGGHTKSCGCLQREKVGTLNRSHGMSGTKAYNTWTRMKERCFNENNPAFEKYGALGTTVCDGWRDSFEAFFAQMGNPPSASHSIDRKNTWGHYSCGRCKQCRKNEWPFNCRWATDEEQARNKTNNRYITINGETKCLMEWSEIYGIDRTAAEQRVKRDGMSWEEAITTPITRDMEPIEIGGIAKPLAHWAKEYGMSPNTVSARVKKGEAPLSALTRTPAGNRMIEIDRETKSLIDWARQYDIDPTTVTSRHDRYGWPWREAITTPIDTRRRKKK